MKIIASDPANPLATLRLQSAIDETAASGGGRVIVGPGSTGHARNPST